MPAHQPTEHQLERKHEPTLPSSGHKQAIQVEDRTQHQNIITGGVRYQ